MLQAVSSYLANQLYIHCRLDASKKEVYQYGIQLSLSTLASACSVIMLSLLLGEAITSFAFLGIFFFLRLFAGGYHARTYMRCFLLTNAVYLTVFFASEIVRNTQLYSLLPVIAITSCLIISVLAPVRNKNHPLSAGAYNRNRKIALCIVLIETSILIVLWFWKSIRPFLIVPTMSLAAVAVMMIITLFRKEENEL